MTKVQRAGPVDCDFVFLLEGGNEVIGSCLFADVFYTEVVNAKCERKTFVCASKETRSVWCWVIAVAISRNTPSGDCSDTIGSAICCGGSIGCGGGGGVIT